MARSRFLRPRPPRNPPAAVGDREMRRPRTLTRVEFAGLSRTRPERAERATGLAVPTEATPERIAEALENPRVSRLFESVEAHTCADRAGGVVLVLAVRETRPAWRFGVGHEDFSSSYLIPAQLAFDNLDGRGLGASASVRPGDRVTGFEAMLRRPPARDARDFWEVRLAAARSTACTSSTAPRLSTACSAAGSRCARAARSRPPGRSRAGPRSRR